MKQIYIAIETDNAAFQENEHSMGHELARIFEKLAEAVKEDNTLYPHYLYDVNGNLVGEVKISE